MSNEKGLLQKLGNTQHPQYLPHQLLYLLHQTSLKKQITWEKPVKIHDKIQDRLSLYLKLNEGTLYLSQPSKFALSKSISRNHINAKEAATLNNFHYDCLQFFWLCTTVLCLKRCFCLSYPSCTSPYTFGIDW